MSGPSERDEIAADRDALAVTEISEVLASWCSKSGDDMGHLLCGELVHRQHREQAEALMHWLAERDRRTAATAVREALGSDEEPDMLRAMLHDAADRLANPRHRGNEHAWPKHAAMFRHLAGRIERNQ